MLYIFDPILIALYNAKSISLVLPKGWLPVSLIWRLGVDQMDKFSWAIFLQKKNAYITRSQVE